MASPTTPIPRANPAWQALAAALATPPPDRPPALWLSIARHAADLALREPALHAAARAAVDAAHARAAAALAPTLAAMPPSRIPTPDLRRTIDRNLSIRSDLQRSLAAARPAWEAAIDAQRWYRAADGNIARLGPAPDPADPDAWAGQPIAVGDLRTQALALVPKPNPEAERSTPPLCYLEGISPPWLLQELALRRYLPSSLGASSRILVLQADPLEFLDALAHADLADILAQPRVECFVGPDAHQRLRDRLRDLGHTALTGVGLLTPGTRTRSAPDMPSIVKDALTAQRLRLDSARDRVARRLADRDADWWADRYARADVADPLRILVITSRYSTYVGAAGRDLAASFNASGCRAELFVEPDDHANVTSVGLYEALDRLDPDLIVTFNYPRRTLAMSVPDAIPLLCWIQDPMPHLFDARNFTPEPARRADRDYYLGHDHPELRALGLDPRRLLACPVLASEQTFHPPAGATAPLARRAHDLACDIAIVTNHGQPPHLYFHDLCESAGIPRHKRDAVIHAMARLDPLVNNPMSGSLRTAVGEVAAEISTLLGGGGPDHPAMVRRHFLAPIVDRVIRHTTAHWAADLARTHNLRLHIHGRGWEHAPDFAPFLRGPVEHGPALRDVYATAGVTLHASLAWPVHQRVLETALSGGLPALYLKADDLQTLQGIVSRALSEEAAPSHSNLPTRATIAQAIDHPRAALATSTLQRLSAWMPAPPPFPGLTAQGFRARYPWQARDPATTPASLAGPFEEAMLLGDLDAVGFNSAQRLLDVVRRAQSDTWREQVSAGIARRARASFTYEAAAARIPRFIAQHLASTAARRRTTVAA